MLRSGNPRDAIRLLFYSVCCLLSSMSCLSTQWLNYPTAGIPRLPDGKPNLNAPAPRTADGKPDLSGIWDIEHNRPCPKEGCPDMPVGQEFFNIGWSRKDGLPYQPWAAALVKETTESNYPDSPTTRC